MTEEEQIQYVINQSLIENDDRLKSAEEEEALNLSKAIKNSLESVESIGDFSSSSKTSMEESFLESFMSDDEKKALKSKATGDYEYQLTGSILHLNGASYSSKTGHYVADVFR